MNKKKIAVIGSGPAGLAAASACDQSDVKTILFDLGKQHKERKHTLADDLGIGIGGAGLFSDGKFSFFPSGSQIYKLENKSLIKDSYNWSSILLDRFGIYSSSFPDIENADASNNSSNHTHLKEYLSSYGNFSQRKALTEELAYLKNCSIHTNTKVCRIGKYKNQYLIDYNNEVLGTKEREVVDAIVLATGRLGNIFGRIMTSDIKLGYQGMRYEFGLRIETPSNIGFLSRLKNPDVKMIWKTSFGEIRTFCTCREGEIWNIPYDRLSAMSGRSDGVKSGYSNFGLLLRFADQGLTAGEKFFNTILASDTLKKRLVVWQTLDSFLNPHEKHLLENNIDQIQRPWHPNKHFVNKSIAHVVGRDIYALFKEAVSVLLDWSPDLLNQQAAVLFPTIEGTGMYPSLNSNLQVNGEKIWCCGDVTGKFRGLVPAFVSGYYTGRCVLNSLEN